MMNKLQQYFPMIRTKEEVLKEIENNSKLKEIYENWQEDEREEFLAFVTGTKGVKMSRRIFIVVASTESENT